MALVGIFLLAALFVVLAWRDYRHICHRDQGYVFEEKRRDSDWQFPPRWKPEGRSQLGVDR